MSMIPIYAALKAAGLRPTSSRMAVLKLFHDLPDQHFFADQVYRRLADQEEPCSLASVYRALNQLHEADLILSASLGETRVVYEMNRGQRHNHLVCDRCGRIQDAYDLNLERRLAEMAASLDFHYASSNLVIFGNCAECSKPSIAATSRARRS